VNYTGPIFELEVKGNNIWIRKKASELTDPIPETLKMCFCFRKIVFTNMGAKVGERKTGLLF